MAPQGAMAPRLGTTGLDNNPIYTLVSRLIAKENTVANTKHGLGEGGG